MRRWTDPVMIYYEMSIYLAPDCAHDSVGYVLQFGGNLGSFEHPLFLRAGVQVLAQ